MPTDASILKRIVKGIQEEEHDPLTPLIDEYLIKRNLPKYQHLRLRQFTIDVGERPRPGGRLSPSSLCGCERQAMLKFVGARGRKRVDPDQELIFEDGHWRHHKWGYLFTEMELILGRDRFRAFHIEHPVVMEKHRIAGHLDIEIEIKVDGKWLRYVVDFKGANNFAFERAYRDRNPDKTYVKQLIAYMKGRKAKRGILLYDSKDKNRLNVFVVKMDPKIWDEVKAWCHKVIRQVEAQELPPMHPDCNNGNFLYGRCMFAAICFGNKTEREIKREVYVDFPGVDKLWKRGLAEIEDHRGED